MISFQSHTAEDFRQELVTYFEGMITLEENAVGSYTSKREQQLHESRRNLLIELSDKLKEAQFYREKDNG